MNSLRCIDVTIHDLTAPQILEQVLNMFRESTKEPVTILTARGTGQGIIQRLRAELTRARKNYESRGLKTSLFGFKSQKITGISMNGVSYDSYVLTYRITKLQQMKNLSRLDLIEIGEFNV
jgi:hypothetical protein